MAEQLQTVDDLIRALRSEGVSQVAVSGRVATTTSPGGDQIAFRGRLVVSADLPAGQRLEYVEQVMPYITQTKSPDLPPTAESAAALRGAQLALARQLRAYRGEYQGVLEAARSRLLAALAQAGIEIVDREDQAAR